MKLQGSVRVVWVACRWQQLPM